MILIEITFLSDLGEKTPSERWEMNRRPVLVRERFLSDASSNFLEDGGGWTWNFNLPNH
jgi:hypothetical protein